MTSTSELDAHTDDAGEPAHSHSFELALADADSLRALSGSFNNNIKLIEDSLGVQINNHGNHFTVMGSEHATEVTQTVLKLAIKQARQHEVSSDDMHLLLQQARTQRANNKKKINVSVQTRKAHITPRSTNQATYIEQIRDHDLSFGIGAAGTGKTYLAVACAVEALENESISRIVLVRPAVEAGEKLGFLPGDLSQKVDPYLRPMYDALYEMLGTEKTHKLIERGVIEVAPLAYMRGRTLSHSFIIMDEAQNTTKEQMKMFLTRLGFDSTAVVNGDISQIDLPHSTLSGLRHAIDVLSGIDGIAFTHFDSSDVVRHRLVRKIVDAYDAYDMRKAKQEKQG